ncbi:MAG: precorrin-2 dehydrogenase/sirohydrochlorin ferrochelatase family protein [Actinomycetota bacterium]
MIDANLYVACLVLEGRPALVVGEGPLAREKVEGLELCGAEVNLVASDDYSADLLTGCLLVVAATSDMELNRRIFADAEERAMLVNVADVPELCNFILPAIVRKPPLTVAISTSGASPALAKRIKREIDERFGAEYARLGELLDEVRAWAKENLATYDDRKRFFEAIVEGDPDPIELLRAGDEAAVRHLIIAAQEAASAASQR